MGKVLFSKVLDDDSRFLRDVILGKISKYHSLSSSNLLEVGCGNGRFATFLGPYLRSYTGIDPDEEYIGVARTTSPVSVSAQYLVGSAEAIPVIHEKFDVVLYAFSWHFIRDVVLAVREAKRVLKDDGLVVIVEPSVTTKNWASAKLRPDSKDYDVLMYEKKLSELAKGRANLEWWYTHGFRLLEEEVGRYENFEVFVFGIDKE